MTLTEFLVVRIAEDEAVARAAVELWQDYKDEWDLATPSVVSEHITRHDPARVLAECEAKRRIVVRHPQAEGVEAWMDDAWIAAMSEDERAGYCPWCTYDDRTVRYPCPDLRIIAAVYADHPDYDESWRP